MYGKVSSRVVVLWDVENILYAAHGDFPKALSRKDLVTRLAKEVKDIAFMHGEHVELCAALSIATIDQSDDETEHRIHKSRRDVVQMSMSLVDSGFSVILVSREPDAADFALCDFGVKAIHDLYVSTIILVTGDGHEPFLSFIDEAKKSGKNVCVVGYDKIPKHVKDRPVKRVLMAKRFRAHNEDALFEGFEGVSEGTETSPRIIPLPPTEVGDEYAGAIKEFAVHGTISSCLLKLVDAIRIVRQECIKKPGGRFTFNYLEKRIYQAMRDVFPGISVHEVRKMLQAVVNWTDVLRVADTYTFNPTSVFLARLREE